MIALPQYCSTSFRWRGALHMLHLKGTSPWKPQQTVANRGGAVRGPRLDEWLFILWDNDTGVHWKCATIKSIKEEY